MLLGRTLAALFFLAATPIQAGPKLTTVQDSLYKADGTRFNGTLAISWNSFDAADTSVVEMQTLNVNVNNGALYVQLVPTTDATPAAVYTVQYQSDGRQQFEERWVVPPATHTLRVRDVRSVQPASTSSTGTGSGPAASGGVAPTAPITEDTVIGLTADLAVRPVKGPGYANGRAAVVNETGGIEVVAGNLSDCVHVDGTAGACFDSSLLPSYSDAETPGGLVDGANSTFTLARAPSPAASLQIFRNGLVMNPGSDYTVNASAVIFVNAAIPHPGDTLVAWYRGAATGSLSAGGLSAGGLSAGGLTGTNPPAFAPAHAEVLCSAEGASTTSVLPASVGSCVIPAHILQAGDRVAIRAMVVHQGSESPAILQVNWGNSAFVVRTIDSADPVFSLSGDATLAGGRTIFVGQSFGQTTTLSNRIGVGPASVGASVRLDFLLNLTSANTTDTLNLANYTIVRYPAISHP